MKNPILPLLMLVAGCATEVYQPGKGKAEVLADIAQCKEEANQRHYWDRIAALNFADTCLKAKGYSRMPAGGRSEPAPAERVRQAAEPCEVPCSL